MNLILSEEKSDRILGTLEVLGWKWKIQIAADEICA
jgi:hypothetical protein